MFRTLMKTESLAVEDRTVAVRYFELRTLRGARRQSAEFYWEPGTASSPDDDSVTNLEARRRASVPATALQPVAGAHDRGSLRQPTKGGAGRRTTAAAPLPQPGFNGSGVWGNHALFPRQDRVLQLLGDPRLDDGLGGNLDGLARGRVPAHALCASEPRASPSRAARTLPIASAPSPRAPSARRKTRAPAYVSLRTVPRSEKTTPICPCVGRRVHRVPPHLAL